MDSEVEKKEKPKLKPSVKPKVILLINMDVVYISITYFYYCSSLSQGKSTKATGDEDRDSSTEEYIVEKILAKRFNPKKRCSEYLLKWEGYSQ